MNTNDPEYLSFLDLLRDREGDSEASYMDLDSLAFGYGSQATPEEAERFPLGTSVPSDYREDRLQQDAQAAWLRAMQQSHELGIDPTTEMKTSLASANYQLGSGWLDEHHRTREALSNQDWEAASQEVGSSL